MIEDRHPFKWKTLCPVEKISYFIYSTLFSGCKVNDVEQLTTPDPVATVFVYDRLGEEWSM